MDLIVQLFGPAREAAGTASATVTLREPATARGVLEALGEAYPGLAPILSRARVAVNHAYADGADAIGPGDTVAVIPPVGGG